MPLHRALPRLLILLLPALWAVMVLLGLMLLGKQQSLTLDLAVARVAVLADTLDSTWHSTSQTGLTLTEAQGLAQRLAELQQKQPDILAGRLFSVQDQQLQPLFTAVGQPLAASPLWLARFQRESGFWRLEQDDQTLIIGKRLLDENDRVVGGYVLRLNATPYFVQVEAARHDLMRSLLATALIASLALTALLLLLHRLPLPLGLRGKTLTAALLVLICAGGFLAQRTSRDFAQHLQPALQAQAEAVADFLQGRIEHALSLGIPYDGLTGVEAYFDDILERHGELAAIRLGEKESRNHRHGAGVDQIGNRTNRDLAVGEAQTIRLSVSTDPEHVAARMREIAIDLAMVLLASLIVFNEVLGYALARLAEGKKALPGIEASPLDAVRLPLFLFILTEELTRAFLPLHIRELALAGDGPARSVGLPITVYMLAFALATPFAGGLADRYGAKRVFNLGCGLALAGFAWAAWTGGYWQFTLARALCAAGYAIATMACQRLILSESDDSSRARGLALFVGAVGIAAICGSAVGGIMAERLGAQAVFALSALICMICIALFAVIRPGSRATADAPFAWSDILLLLRQPRFALLMLAAAIPAKIALAGFLFYLVPLALAGLDYSPAAIGRAVMVYFVTLVCVTPLAARLSDRYRLRLSLVVIGGLIIGLGALTGLLQAAWADRGVLLAIAALGLGTGLSAASLQALAGEIGSRVSKADGYVGQMTAMVVFRMVERLGSALGPLLLGLPLIWYAYGEAMTALGGIMMLASLILVWALRRTSGHSGGLTPHD